MSTKLQRRVSRNGTLAPQNVAAAASGGRGHRARAAVADGSVACVGAIR